MSVLPWPPTLPRRPTTLTVVRSASAGFWAWGAARSIIKAFPGKVGTGFPKRKCDKTWNLERFPPTGCGFITVNVIGKRSSCRQGGPAVTPGLLSASRVRLGARDWPQCAGGYRCLMLMPRSWARVAHALGTRQRCSSLIHWGAPTVSATVAPRDPSGLGGPVVVSRAV